MFYIAISGVVGGSQNVIIANQIGVYSNGYGSSGYASFSNNMMCGNTQWDVAINFTSYMTIANNFWGHHQRNSDSRRYSGRLLTTGLWLWISDCYRRHLFHMRYQISCWLLAQPSSSTTLRHRLRRQHRMALCR